MGLGVNFPTLDSRLLKSLDVMIRQLSYHPNATYLIRIYALPTKAVSQLPEAVVAGILLLDVGAAAFDPVPLQIDSFNCCS